MADYPTHPDAMQPAWLAETLGFSGIDAARLFGQTSRHRSDVR